ncbi:MAG: Rrf2 family transcriptional regulator [Ignavibacteriales bacterium]|nr:Rrf2 family transcriptional regulator [Ignavibacteriales bacterium]
MIFNKSTEYSVKILIYMNEVKGYKYLSAGDISSAIKIPKEYLSKILQRLTHRGFVYSKRGKGGGFKLLKSNNEIELKELINLFDNEKFYTKCLIGLSDDCNQCKCSVHNNWVNLKNVLVSSNLENIKSDSFFTLK